MELSRETVLAYHEWGKVGMCCKRPMAGVKDLCLAYTPGVAEAVKQIAEDASTVRRYSAMHNLVAVVTDGTAILGLGDLGASASIPVMEGKAVLFKSFGDVDSWPVPLNCCRQGGANSGPTDPERVIDAVAAIAPMYAGINLEDIAAPACFEIEDRLDAMLDIPVFHDDQWGTAVITLAGIFNYARLCERELGEMRYVINGAGAAGIRIAEMLQAAGAEDIIVCDSKGIITQGRGKIEGRKGAFAVDRSPGTVADAMEGAHVFIGVSVGDCVEPEAIKQMASYPAVFAMANPTPEIHPDRVAAAMGDKPYVMATGRSDFANQVNNVLGFPFLFRGALDAGAKTINMAMKRAAAEALAALAREPVPEDVQAIYPDEALAYGPEYIIPKPFDRRLFVEVSSAVAAAAIESGAAMPGVNADDIRQCLVQRNERRD